MFILVDHKLKAVFLQLSRPCSVEARTLLHNRHFKILSVCGDEVLLPRLLSAHRLEVRRLLRGALASIGRRLDSLERRSRRKTRKKRSRQRGEEEEEAGAACSPGEFCLQLYVDKSVY